MEVFEIADKIEKLRNERGWSIYKLADEAGLTQSTLINMRTRGTLPSITTLNGLCNAFGITLAEFFSENEDNTTLSQEEKFIISAYRKLSYKNKNAVVALLEKLGE